MEEPGLPPFPDEEDEISEDQEEDNSDDDDIQAKKADTLGIYSVHGLRGMVRNGRSASPATALIGIYKKPFP